MTHQVRAKRLASGTTCLLWTARCTIAQSLSKLIWDRCFITQPFFGISGRIQISVFDFQIDGDRAKCTTLLHQIKLEFINSGHNSKRNDRYLADISENRTCTFQGTITSVNNQYVFCVKYLYVFILIIFINTKIIELGRGDSKIDLRSNYFQIQLLFLDTKHKFRATYSTSKAFFSSLISGGILSRILQTI